MFQCLGILYVVGVSIRNPHVFQEGYLKKKELGKFFGSTWRGGNFDSMMMPSTDLAFKCVGFNYMIVSCLGKDQDVQSI